VNELREQIKKEALRLYSELEYIYRACFTVVERKRRTNLWLGISSIILSALAGSIALSKIVPHVEIFAGLSGFSAATLTSLLIFLKLTGNQYQYSDYGKKYLTLREGIRRFIEIEFLTEKPVHTLKAQLESFITEKKTLDLTSPFIPAGVYRKEQRRAEIRKGARKREVEKIGKKRLSLFEKYLTLWVLVCIGAGIGLGRIAPGVAIKLDALSVYQVSIPIAICLFFMMYPIMVKIDFAKVLRAAKTPKPVVMTLIINWAIKPFTMFFIASFFIGYLFKGFLPGTEILRSGQEVELWRSYISGAILLGIAPCTAMVLMWSYLAKGNDGLTLVMVAINSLTMLVLYAPLGGFLLGINAMPIPWQTILFSVAIYVALPLVTGYFTRKWVIKSKGLEWFNEKFLHWLTPVSIVALLATLALLFSFKGEIIVKNPLTILWISIPLFVQTIVVFSVGYFALSRLFRLSYEDAAPAAMIGASNHFEVAIATATMLFGLSSGAALATVVGVLIEVPVMLMLVSICKKTCNLLKECSLELPQCKVSQPTSNKVLVQ